MSKLKDMSGYRFGRLVITKKTGSNEKGCAVWECICDCGNVVHKSGELLRRGFIKSCGCLYEEVSKQGNPKHNKSNTRIYRIWSEMKRRCLNPNDARYRNYGGRGIKVCNEWLHDFQAFYDWAMSHGYTDNLTIDRIDNDGNYEPSNCRWTTYKQQANNTSNNHFLTYNGETHTISEWSMITGIKSQTISNRIRRGWSIERSLTDKSNLRIEV